MPGEEEEQSGASHGQEEEEEEEEEQGFWTNTFRGLRWRVMLKVLPPCPAPLEDLRRAAANSRRRYAELRRHLLVDPHIMEEAQKPPHLGVDNPLSQEPDSIWGRYFRNAELEKTIDQDLTRLYPEYGSFFQSHVCQSILRRILLVWTLNHPSYSYRQGMHELLAPLLYIVHVDVAHLWKLKERYEDLFDDRFDNLGEQKKPEKESLSSFVALDSMPIPNRIISKADGNWVSNPNLQDLALIDPDEFGFNLRVIVLGSDLYGAEGELGCLVSERFAEHDAYSMFDALMSGEGGGITMADYFMPTNGLGLSTAGISPVLEASSLLYRILATIDNPLYTHLLRLGVEPQFFALRWLRVLFGREFTLGNLMLLWDAIFSTCNTALDELTSVSGYRHSHRSVFILAMAVSMLLQLRPSLLAAPDASTCLQKLLNFPSTTDVRSLVSVSKMLHPFASEAVNASPISKCKFSSLITEGTVKQNGADSGPKFRPSEISRQIQLDSYWEERWRNFVLQRIAAEEAAAAAKKARRHPKGKESSPKQEQGGSLCKSPSIINVTSGMRKKSGNNESFEFGSSSRGLNTDSVVSDISKSTTKGGRIKTPEIFSSPNGDCFNETSGNLVSEANEVGNAQTVDVLENVIPRSENGVSSSLSQAEDMSVESFQASLKATGTKVTAPLNPRNGRFSWVWSFRLGYFGGRKSKAKDPNPSLEPPLEGEEGSQKSHFASSEDGFDEAREVHRLIDDDTSDGSSSSSVSKGSPDLVMASSQLEGCDRETILHDDEKKDLIQDTSDVVKVYEFPTEADPPGALPSLGQSISNNIKILEVALSHVANSSSNGDISINVLESRVNPKVEEALVELKKVSDTLLKM